MRCGFVVLAVASFVAIGQPTQAAGNQRNPWSGLFAPNAKAEHRASLKFDFAQPLPRGVNLPPSPCAVIRSRPVDPAFDRNIRAAVPTKPQSSARTQSRPSCAGR
jgi:hypothetical protein